MGKLLQSNLFFIKSRHTRGCYYGRTFSKMDLKITQIQAFHLVASIIEDSTIHSFLLPRLDLLLLAKNHLRIILFQSFPIYSFNHTLDKLYQTYLSFNENSKRRPR